MKSFFFDTYAFYEIIAGNENYRKYSKEVRIFTSQLNLMELYYQMILLYDKKTAMDILDKYEEFIFPITKEIMIEAMDFRKQNKKKKMSYADCIGYTISKKINVRFLTGDKEFENMPNVEFVK